ncbi:hypothetical protein NAI31_12055, partial [Francisella tularensis subsp. holarctica]|nr:hypothetical protein [Francisella tularensis subsp. holarctica]
EDIITLRAMDYKNAITGPINPHYFGKIKLNDKNQFTKFITIGSLSEKRKSTKLLINAAKELVDKGGTQFKITVLCQG